MDLGLRGRVALVVGAGSGIGEAVALGLAREGASLIVAARDLQRLNAVAERARELGAPEAHAFHADLRDAGSVAEMLDRARRAFGGIDVAVLNGGGPPAGRFGDVTLDDWDAAYRLILRGMVEIAGALVPAMRAKRWGRVVALTSTSVKQPIDALVLSNAFRTALVAALRTLAVEAARDGVTINCIATGRVDTARLRELYEDEEAMRGRAEAEVPIGRVASADEFAPMAVFLCSEAARYVTGQTISVDGGLVRGLFG